MDETLRFEPRSLYDEAIVGLINRCGQPPVLAYSFERLMEVITRSGETSPDEAAEHIFVNMIGGWCGAGTPAVIEEMSVEEIESLLE